MEKKKKTSLDFESSDYSLWAEKIKEKFSLDSEKELAGILGIQPSGFSHFKRSNRFPFDKVVELYIEKGLSLDGLFGIKDTALIHSKKELIKEKSKYDIPFLLNKNNALSIPMLISQNESSSLVAFTQDNMIYIINTSVNKYIKKANYLLEKNDIYYIRNIDMTLDNNFEICEINNHDSKGHVFSKEELEKFTIVGMVEYSLKAELQRV